MRNNGVKKNDGLRGTETIDVPAAYGKTFQELSQKLLEAAPDAMLFVESSGRIALVNAQLEKLFGYSRHELIGKDLHILLPERFRTKHGENIARFFEDPVTRPMGTGLKIYGRKKDGEEFRADISLSPLHIDGKVLVTAAIRDITERVRAEEQIQFDYEVQRVISTILKIALEPISLDDQLARTLELIMSVPDPELEAKGLIYLFDKTAGKFILRTSRGFPDVPGAPADSREGSHAGGPVCKMPTKELNCEIFQTGNPDAPYQIISRQIGSFIHYCIPIHEGENILGLISIFAKEWPGSKPQEEVFFRALSHTLAVIIKRYQSENERQKLIEQLTETEKMAALGRISANVAHEIRNPLTVVGGFARRLQRSAPEETREREYSSFIVSEVSRLEEILKSILAYSKTTALHLQSVLIHQIINEVLNMYEELYGDRSVTVRRSYNYIPEILVDRERAREVIVNMVSNALDAMPRGGTLAITTEKAEINGGPFLRVTISDTGGGIPADRLDKIFEPFFTTKVSERGIGLGLSISKKIMEDHGGFITVESTPGKGTKFDLYFPVKGASVKAEVEK